MLEILARGRFGETYNIGADQKDINNREVIELICELMDIPGQYELVADRPGHDQRYAMDASKLREELGWRPRYTDLRAGLIDTIAWYRENTAWWQDAKEKVESTYAAQGQ